MTRVPHILLLVLVACNGDPSGKPPDLNIDADGDGYLPYADCDDQDAAVHPGAIEACNAVDDDCDGTVDEALPLLTFYADEDGDGHGRAGAEVQACARPDGFADQPGDCDDTDPRFHPGADEPCTENADYNCDGSVQFADSDADGVPACLDCSDVDPGVYPGAPERCNDIDDDCNGTVDDDAVDPSTWYADQDEDGYGDDTVPTTLHCDQLPFTAAVGGDCDDTDPAYHPGAPEDCADPSDYNCDGSVLFEDFDADATPACLDCDDTDDTAYPGAPETCDDTDDDCDTVIDNDPVDPADWYFDGDGDGHGDPEIRVDACDAPADHVAEPTDCDDTDPTVSPDAPEVCDPLNRDEDCDLLADDEDDDPYPATLTPFYADGDADGFGADGPLTVMRCDLPDGYSPTDDDCDDARPDVSPAGVEVCGADLADEDCDGLVNDDDVPLDPATWYADDDGDMYGNASATLEACVAPTGFVADQTDCDDQDDTAYPGATEYCDGVDDDCDQTIDEEAADALTFYVDDDGDGYGTLAATVAACAVPPGYAVESTDCDDTRADVSPAGSEVCDAADADENCDTLVDDADPTATGQTPFYFDADGDGYGDATLASTPSCDPPAGYVAGIDCDDADVTEYPGAVEIAGNLEDDDCDGSELCLLDADDDGYLPDTPGTVPSPDLDCDDAFEAPIGAPAGDCNDLAASAFPGGTEVCNGIDDDCEGDVDEGLAITYFADTDGDGYGDAGTTTFACSPPTGYVLDATDCDDSAANVHPGHVEVCDGLDNNCVATDTDCVFDGIQPSEGATAQVYGNNKSDYLGRSVAVGDFDGDGQDDLLAGMTGYDSPASSAGAAVMWYGPVTTSGASSSDLLMTGNGVGTENTGWDVAVTDFDGDGMDEMVIGAYGVSSYAGAVYLIHGGTLVTGTVTAGGLTATDGATYIGGASSDYLGWSLGNGGDLDGDGFEELLMGAKFQDGAGSSSGAVYVVYGSATLPTGSTTAPLAADAILQGSAASDYLGYSLTAIPDVNGDGLDELLIGVQGDDGAGSSAGAAHVILGDAVRLSGTLSAATVADVTVRGTVSFDYAGTAVAGLGDVDGDGYADYAVGADGHDGGGSSAGALLVARGGAAPTNTVVATIQGHTSSLYLGEEPGGPGDLDGDGYSEVIVGAYGYDDVNNQAGAVFLFYGPLAGTISSGAADATFVGSRISGGDSYLGDRLVSTPADVTGDGALDVILGAYYDDVGNSDGFHDPGAVYVFTASDVP